MLGRSEATFSPQSQRGSQDIVGVLKEQLHAFTQSHGDLGPEQQAILSSFLEAVKTSNLSTTHSLKITPPPRQSALPPLLEDEERAIFIPTTSASRVPVSGSSIFAAFNADDREEWEKKLDSSGPAGFKPDAPPPNNTIKVVAVAPKPSSTMLSAYYSAFDDTSVNGAPKVAETLAQLPVKGSGRRASLVGRLSAKIRSSVARQSSEGEANGLGAATAAKPTSVKSPTATPPSVRSSHRANDESPGTSL